MFTHNLKNVNRDCWGGCVVRDASLLLRPASFEGQALLDPACDGLSDDCFGCPHAHSDSPSHRYTASPDKMKPTGEEERPHASCQRASPARASVLCEVIHNMRTLRLLWLLLVGGMHVVLAAAELRRPAGGRTSLSLQVTRERG